MTLFFVNINTMCVYRISFSKELIPPEFQPSPNPVIHAEERLPEDFFGVVSEESEVMLEFFPGVPQLHTFLPPKQGD